MKSCKKKQAILEWVSYLECEPQAIDKQRNSCCEYRKNCRKNFWYFVESFPNNFSVVQCNYDDDFMLKPPETSEVD